MTDTTPHGDVPLSADDRLAALNERFDDAVRALWNLTESPVDGDGLDEYDTVRQCWTDLLADRERLREREVEVLALLYDAITREAALLAERERLLAVVRAVAQTDFLMDDESDWVCCRWSDDCGWRPVADRYTHDRNCPVTQARAALASVSEAAADGASAEE